MTSRLNDKAAQTEAVTQQNLPRLSTVKNLPTCFPLLSLSVAAVQGHIFKSQDRYDSRGRKIPGNGLAEFGAIIRRGRSVIIDVDKYRAWLASGTEN